MKEILSHFSRPNPKTIGAAVTAILGMFLAFGHITDAQFQAGGVLVMALLAFLKPSRKESE